MDEDGGEWDWEEQGTASASLPDAAPSTSSSTSASASAPSPSLLTAQAPSASSPPSHPPPHALLPSSQSSPQAAATPRSARSVHSVESMYEEDAEEPEAGVEDAAEDEEEGIEEELAVEEEVDREGELVKEEDIHSTGDVEGEYDDDHYDRPQPDEVEEQKEAQDAVDKVVEVRHTERAEGQRVEWPMAGQEQPQRSPALLFASSSPALSSFSASSIDLRPSPLASSHTPSPSISHTMAVAAAAPQSSSPPIVPGPSVISPLSTLSHFHVSVTPPSPSRVLRAQRDEEEDESSRALEEEKGEAIAAASLRDVPWGKEEQKEPTSTATLPDVCATGQADDDATATLPSPRLTKREDDQRLPLQTPLPQPQPREAPITSTDSPQPFHLVSPPATSPNPPSTLHVTASSISSAPPLHTVATVTIVDVTEEADEEHPHEQSAPSTPPSPPRSSPSRSPPSQLQGLIEPEVKRAVARSVFPSSSSDHQPAPLAAPTTQGSSAPHLPSASLTPSQPVSRVLPPSATLPTPSTSVPQPSATFSITSLSPAMTKPITRAAGTTRSDTLHYPQPYLPPHSPHSSLIAAYPTLSSSLSSTLPFNRTVPSSSSSSSPLPLTPVPSVPSAPSPAYVQSRQGLLKALAEHERSAERRKREVEDARLTSILATTAPHRHHQAGWMSMLSSSTVERALRFSQRAGGDSPGYVQATTSANAKGAAGDRSGGGHDDAELDADEAWLMRREELRRVDERRWRERSRWLREEAKRTEREEEAERRQSRQRSQQPRWASVRLLPAGSTDESEEEGSVAGSASAGSRSSASPRSVMERMREDLQEEVAWQTAMRVGHS